jgi:alcohol dehydrogenase class IV
MTCLSNYVFPKKFISYKKRIPIMFKFQAATKFVFGVDTINQLGQEIQALDGQKAFIVTDKGIVNAGILDRVTQSLVDANIEIAVFDQIEPNPTDAAIMAGAQRLKGDSADVVIGLGGGSPLDAAKGIAVMATNEGQVTDYCGVGADPWPNPPRPILAIPTTAGTGAEVSSAAMINIPAQGRKMDMFGPSILPKVAIADPTLTLGLPPHLTAQTGIDALSHAVEAYVCARANPISDAIAERAISLVAENIRQAYANGRDLAARGNMLLASAMAVIAASNAGGLGVIHSLAQTLGGFYDLPHGLSIAVCFPYGLAYNVLAVPDKYATVARLLGANTAGISTFEAAKAVVPAMQTLLTDLDITDTLQTLGVKQADIPELAEKAMLDGCTPPNPRPLNPAGFVKLYERALNNSL